MNYIHIHGRLGRDPELKEYKNAKGEPGKLAKFSVGVNRDTGDDTDWFDCTVFGKRAEVVEKFLKKGSEVTVTGHMESRKYEDKNGNKRTAWGVNVIAFDFCGKKSDSQEQAPAFEETEEEIPF